MVHSLELFPHISRDPTGFDNTNLLWLRFPCMRESIEKFFPSMIPVTIPHYTSQSVRPRQTLFFFHTPHVTSYVRPWHLSGCFRQVFVWISALMVWPPQIQRKFWHDAGLSRYYGIQYFFGRDSGIGHPLFVRAPINHKVLIFYQLFQFWEK